MDDPTKTQVEEKLAKLESRYSDKLKKNYDLSRSLVSFQANKKVPGYRWYKFKEGFSLALVKYFFRKLNIPQDGHILDPFAGSGTTLFAASQNNLNSTGIELLPIGEEIIQARKILFSDDKERYREKIKTWTREKPWCKIKNPKPLNEIAITSGAYPQKNKYRIEQYLTAVGKLKDPKLSRVLRFALLCILEEISYTRKDGQYLRWDHRATRSRSKFDKGKIEKFDDSIEAKLNQLYIDSGKGETLFNNSTRFKTRAEIEILRGSCLKILPKLEKGKFSAVITSPPYCNRYDYTRTYALELALLGMSNKEVKKLRQTMLSCTVENKEKKNINELLTTELFSAASASFNGQEAINTIVSFLKKKKKNKKLNNNGIVRMIRNYFFEMSLVIFELGRLLKPGGYFIMVNDNVRYAGVNIPVDLILSDFAKDAGFKIKKIWVLPNGKGNSSQQMGKHGRKELRKCVYVWEKL